MDNIKNSIVSFEKENPVSEWKYAEMDLWPIIRSLVFVECRNEINEKNYGVKLDWKRTSKSNRARNLLKSLKNWLPYRPGSKPTLGAKPSQIFPERKGNVDALFFGSWYFRTILNGRFVNKYSYPIIERLKEKHGIQSMEVEYAVHPKFAQEYASILGEIEFSRDYPQGKKDEIEFEKLKNHKLFVDLFDTLESEGWSKKLRILIADKIEKIRQDTYRYERLFQKYKPKFAFCLTFFSEQMFSMVFAASKLGVKSIDIGHGFPSDLDNLIYNRKENFPDHGYNTLPDYFWVWGEPVKNAMKQWTASQSKHQVLVGGNPWLEHIVPTLPKLSLSTKKVILYTLTVNLPEDFILEAMENSGEKYEWWIRLHPSVSNSEEEVKKLFSDRGIQNYNLTEANAMDLPLLLKNADLHLSRNSSSIFESIFLGNTPILLDEEAANSYSYFLETARAIFVPPIEHKNLLNRIDQILRKPQKEESLDLKMESALHILFDTSLSEISLKAL